MPPTTAICRLAAPAAQCPQNMTRSLSGPATLQVLQAETDATARRDLARALARFVLSLLSHLTMCWPLPQRQQQYLNTPVEPGSANPSTLSSQQAAQQQRQAAGSDSCSAAVASLLRSLAACDVSTWQQLQQLASGTAGGAAGPAQGAAGSGDDSNDDSDSDSGADEPAVVTGACLAAVYSIAPVTAPAVVPGQCSLLAPPGEPAELLALCCQLGRPLVDLSAGLQSQALLHKALALVADGGKLALQRQRAAGAAAAQGTAWQGGAAEVLESEVWPTLQVGVMLRCHAEVSC
jgi:hypothetical protein